MAAVDNASQIIRSLPWVAKVLRGGRLLELPYASRYPDRFRKVVEESLFQVEGADGSRWVILLARCRGFPSRILCCRGTKISVDYEAVRRVDRLSGLSLWLRRPVLLVDECRAPLEWKNTQFVLDCEGLSKCCRPL